MPPSTIYPRWYVGLIGIDRKWKSRERSPTPLHSSRLPVWISRAISLMDVINIPDILYLRTSVIPFTSSSLSRHLRFVSRHTRSIFTKHFRWLHRRYQPEHYEGAFSCENFRRSKLSRTREILKYLPTRNLYIFFSPDKYLANFWQSDELVRNERKGIM